MFWNSHIIAWSLLWIWNNKKAQVLSIIWSIAPDFDFFLLLTWLWKHRWFTHSLDFLFLLFLVIFFIKWKENKVAYLLFILWYSSHILLDYLTWWDILISFTLNKTIAWIWFFPYSNYNIIFWIWILSIILFWIIFYKKNKDYFKYIMILYILVYLFDIYYIFFIR